MGPVCGVAVESDALRIAYTEGDRRVVESIGLEPSELDRMSRDLIDRIDERGPFENIVFTGRKADALYHSTDLASADLPPSVRTLEEAWALLSFVRSLDALAESTDVLVLDLGRHGTSAFSMNPAEGTVLWHDRSESFGGERLDDVVESLVMTKGILPEPDGPDGVEAYRTFFRELRELLTTSTGVRAPNNGPMLLGRDEFEEAVTPLIDAILEWASPEAPQAVVLLGGVANSPLVQRRARLKWQVPLTLPDSQSPVAEGAVIRAETTPTATLDEGPILDDSETEPELEEISTLENSAPEEAAEAQPEPEVEQAIEQPSEDIPTPPSSDLDEPATAVQPSPEVRPIGSPSAAARPRQYIAGLTNREWTRQAVLKVGAVAVSVGVVVVALLFATFGNFDNSPRSVINTDPVFETTLAEVQPTASAVAPPDASGAQGPVTLTDQQLYVEQYTYSGEMYQPTAAEIG
ncbi:hypothetical protein [Rhodococcus sp. 077-4]|uniref:hypothetical protein n=1 Tax=Rhodococcus sp. 077-4 TaxID=2789271 RepID=UPI0039F45602